MLSQRWRPVWYCVGAVLVIWIAAAVGFRIARNSKMTADKVKAYVASIDLKKLSGSARAKAIKDLADRINALSIEERRMARFERVARDWFDEMTEDEKAAFIEATMPTGFKQMLTSFEQLPEDKRRKTIDDTLRRVRQTQGRLQSSGDED